MPQLVKSNLNVAQAIIYFMIIFLVLVFTLNTIASHVLNHFNYIVKICLHTYIYTFTNPQ